MSGLKQAGEEGRGDFRKGTEKGGESVWLI